MDAEVLIVGTAAYFGVGGCMRDGLRMAGRPVSFIDVNPPWARSLVYRGLVRCMGGLTPRGLIANHQVRRLLRLQHFRYVIVTNGSELSADTVSLLRRSCESRGGGVACFLCDDPFNPVHRCDSWMASLAEYSVVVSTKRAVMEDLARVGCRQVAYARFGYHPPVHRPVDARSMGFVACDVALAGNADGDRLPIVGAIVERAPELSLRLYGHGWSAHPALKGIVQPVVRGLRYSAAMQAATVCPCLIRRANRDGHVMRSIELPAMGAFMLAERTDEHQEMFEEGVHCDYWSSEEELVDKARWYVRHPRHAAVIARAGYELITTNPYTYADRALEVMQMLGRTAPGKESALT